jgi:hypothetical protein
MSNLPNADQQRKLDKRAEALRANLKRRKAVAKTKSKTEKKEIK